MERYDSYKDSGVDWLGEIPAHWDVRANRTLFKERNEPGEADLPILSVSLHTGVSDEEQDDEDNARTRNRIADKTAYRRVHRGDVAYNMMRAWQGAIGAVRTEGMVSPAYVVAAPRVAMNPDFFEYQYRTDLVIREMDRASKGITDFRKRLYWNEFKQMSTIVPPLEDQERIVAFLDKKTAEIDAAIAKKERLIELLQEQKSILINHAVTRGLNPDAPMRDSGVEWIGQIPAHWGLQRFKLCVSITSGQVDPTKKQYSSLPLIAPNHIESGTGRLLAIESADDQGADSGKYSVAAGDLLYSKIRPALRKACISPVDGLCSADMYVLRPKPQLDKSYLLGFILTDAFTLPALDAALRVAMPKVNREAMGDFPLLLPPIEEQQKNCQLSE